MDVRGLFGLFEDVRKALSLMLGKCEASDFGKAFVWRRLEAATTNKVTSRLRHITDPGLMKTNLRIKFFRRLKNGCGCFREGTLIISYASGLIYW